MYTYTQADTFLKNRRTNRIDNNTYLERLDDATIGVRFHNTIVVKIHDNNTFTLNTSGYRTVTTKDRLNNYSPARVYRHRGHWMISSTVAFHDGIRVSYNGEPITDDIAAKFNLNDKNERDILADWMTDQKRDSEAALLRSRKKVFLCMGRIETY